MRQRKNQNVVRALKNQNENWLASILATTGFKWTRQAVWGYRIFDFWSHKLGIVVESDGPEHNKNYDAYRDDYNLRRSGILIIRVRNRNEEDVNHALSLIKNSSTWPERREVLGLNVNTKAGRRHLVNGQHDLFSETLPDHDEPLYSGKAPPWL